MRVIRSAAAVMSALSVMACQTMAVVGSAVPPVTARSTVGIPSGDNRSGNLPAASLMHGQGVLGITRGHAEAQASAGQSSFAAAPMQRKTIIIIAVVAAAVVVGALLLSGSDGPGGGY